MARANGVAGPAGNRDGEDDRLMSLAIRDRIRELRRVPAGELKANPKNWRTHSQGQLDALSEIIREVGFAGATLARELEDGSLQLLDGHARQAIAGDDPIPVLVLDVTESEADKIIATYDPLGYLAGVSGDHLDKLLADVGRMPPALDSWLQIQVEGAKSAELIAGLESESNGESGPRLTNKPMEIVKVVIPCSDVALFEKAMSETGEMNRAAALKIICES